MAEQSTDVFTFGETMLRLSPPNFGRLEEAVLLDVRIGGSESNTAVALARLGLRSSWWSRLPANPLGRRIQSEIRRWGVETDGILWDSSPEARVGTYFLDFGLPPRGIDVFYDRAHSSAAAISAEDVPPARIAQARLLHLTGITPALSDSCRAAAMRAVEIARSAGTRVSFDTNYRSRLWPPNRARAVLEPLIDRIDLLFCPLADAATVFNISGTGPDVVRVLRARYGVTTAVVTCGAEGAVACDDRGECAAAAFPLAGVVDRVGAGDAFSAGVMMGWLQNDLQLGLNYGTAMAALKHTMPGDLLLSSREEIEAAQAGILSGIRR